LGRIDQRSLSMVEYVRGAREVLQELRQYEPELFKELKKNMRTDINPIIKPIESQINSAVTSQLRGVRKAGMFHDGRSRWDGVTLSTRVGTGLKQLVWIQGKGKSSSVGFEYAELAGIRRRPPRPVSKGWNETGIGWRSYIVNGQGDAFIRMLSSFGKPGRFLWKRVITRRREIEGKVLDIAENYNVKVNRKLS
jgi:hypothetical protein